MNLTEAKEFRDQCLRMGRKSDGCTFVRDFSFTPACQLHDFLRRYKKVPISEADKLFLEAMLEIAGKDESKKRTAHLYYFGVRYVSVLFGGDHLLAIGIHSFIAVSLTLYIWG